MTKVTVVAVTDGDEWSVLQQGDSGADLLPSAVHTFEFQNKSKTTLSVLQARNKIQAFDLDTDSQGRYNPDAYALASAATFLYAHCESLTRTNGESVEAVKPVEKSLEWIVEEIPAMVLLAYNRRSNPPMLRAAVKKPKPAGEESETATGQETNSESESSETQPGN